MTAKKITLNQLENSRERVKLSLLRFKYGVTHRTLCAVLLGTKTCSGKTHRSKEKTNNKLNPHVTPGPGQSSTLATTIYHSKLKYVGLIISNSVPQCTDLFVISFARKEKN